MLLAALQIAPAPAEAASNTSSAPPFTAELVSAGRSPTHPGNGLIGLDVHLAPGWHTYWRSPGDAGAAPEFDWSASVNLASASVEWPAPRRFSEAGIDTFGYADHVLFPIRLRLQDENAAAHVSLKVELYVCATICTQNTLHFDADLPPGFRSADKQILIGEWRKKVPPSKSDWISIRSIHFERRPPAELRIEAAAQRPLNGADVFVDGDSSVTGRKPEITVGPDGISRIRVPLDGVTAKHPDRPLHATIVDGDRSIETVTSDIRPASAVIAQVASGSNPRSGQQALSSMIALSLLGGLILNFMPCVFPILSLKLFSLVGHGTHDSGPVRARFLVSAAGVVASFLVLAAALAALKSAGAQVGWGIQFQQPLFLAAMSGLLAALGANLLGLYELRLPWRMAGALGQAATGQSLGSHFLNGFVMTLLATPCSAPFVGSAVAFALSQGPKEIAIIFLGLGVGMASPYLLLAAVPQLARLLPRPGRWMLAVRYVAAAAMAATSVWLLTVLADVSGAQTALLIGAAFGIAVWGLAVFRRRFANTIGGAFIVALITVAATMTIGNTHSETAQTGARVQWRPLAPDAVQSMAKDGRTVFVDIGAAWCVTCKVNEALIVGSEPIQQRLASDVVPVRADWTKADPAIAAYIQSFGRYGLPFNAVFGPGAPNGIVLPELLTQEAVLKAFATASSQPSH